MSTTSAELLSSSYELSNSSAQGARKSSTPPVRIDRELVRSGWLYKQANVMKTWKRRYFVLIKRTNAATGDYWASLQYYKGNNFGKLRGEMHLQDGMLSVRFLEPDETKRPFCFEIAGEDFSFVCSGSNDEDASAWVCLLQSLSGGGGSTISPSGSLIGASTANRLLHSGDESKGNRVRPSTIDARSIRIVAELRKVLHTSKSPEAAQYKGFIGSFESRGTGTLRQFREFHAKLTEAIVNDHGARILAALKDPGDDDINAAKSVDKEQAVQPISLDMSFSCRFRKRSIQVCVACTTRKNLRSTARFDGCKEKTKCISTFRCIKYRGKSGEKRLESLPKLLKCHFLQQSTTYLRVRSETFRQLMLTSTTRLLTWRHLRLMTLYQYLPTCCRTVD
uniref:PH domain-containing protein n=1 Tax=Hyaloperonospora arabidopsidis (strain Emoy2) TaxID=559515 RepID=M4BV80_HYAAE